MTSITIAIAMTTVVFFLFPATRLFSAIGTLILTYLYPVVFACLAVMIFTGYGYYYWKKT